jgi:hypothetical protein
MEGPDDLYLIAEKADNGTVIAYYKGFYNHKFKRYTLYPHKLVSNLANFTKKKVSAFDMQNA